jgi:hypothetical protein
MQYNVFGGQQLQQFKSQAKKWCGLLANAVGAADEGEFDGAVAESGGVQTETLLFPVVRVDDAVADGFFEQ